MFFRGGFILNCMICSLSKLRCHTVNFDFKGFKDRKRPRQAAFKYSLYRARVCSGLKGLMGRVFFTPQAGEEEEQHDTL